MLQQNYAWGNTAAFELNALQAGSHNLTATFGGLLGQYDSLNAASSTSIPSTVTVYDRNTPPPAQVTLTIAPSAPIIGEPVTLTASVSQSGYPRDERDGHVS